MTDRTREGGPEAYRRRGPFIHAQSFISTLAVLQRSPIGLTKYALDQSVDARLQQACDDFADALPGLRTYATPSRKSRSVFGARRAARR
jgi:hypothetical protein